MSQIGINKTVARKLRRRKFVRNNCIKCEVGPIFFKICFAFYFSAFSQTELENALLPTWKKMSAYKMTDGKVSRHFRQPVDPNAFNNPANSVVVRKPMDLSTIKTKLTTGQYSNPWEYIGDVWLMFENAWHSNKRTPSIYNCCTRVRE